MKPSSSDNKAAAKKQLDALQVGRGLAALAVLAFHINATFALPHYFNQQVSSLFLWGHSGVEFFFVLSGFLMMLTTRGAKSEVGAVKFLNRRFIRIYPPLWCALIVAVIGIVVAGKDLSKEVTVFQVLSAFLALPYYAVEPLLAVEWTLRREVLFYLLFAVLIWKRSIGTVLLGIWFVGSAIAVLYEPGSKIHAVFEARNLLFGLGMITASIPLAVSNFWSAWGSVCVGFIIFCSSALIDMRYELTHNPSLSLGYGIASALVIYGLCALESQGKIKSFPKTLLLLGDASYSVYLVHFLLVSLATKIVFKLNSTYQLPLLAWFLPVFVFSLLGSLVFYMIFERPLLRQKKKPVLIATPSPT